jgi:hypothetical protein
MDGERSMRMDRVSLTMVVVRGHRNNQRPLGIVHRVIPFLYELALTNVDWGSSEPNLFTQRHIMS